MTCTTRSTFKTNPYALYLTQGQDLARFLGGKGAGSEETLADTDEGNATEMETATVPKEKETVAGAIAATARVEKDKNVLPGTEFRSDKYMSAVKPSSSSFDRNIAMNAFLEENASTC